MLSRTHISAFVGLTIFVWLLVLWIEGQPVLSLSFVRPFGIVVGLIGGISFAFNKWAWAWPCFQGWFVKKPDLRGTWQVLLKSDWINPDTGKGIDPIVGYIVVRQTLMHISVRQMTAESKSHSVSCGITRDTDEIYRLSVVYRNEPDINLQGVRSDIHYGAFWLEAIGNSKPIARENSVGEPTVIERLRLFLLHPLKGPSRLEGHYWTDRNTRGSMEVTDRVCSLHESYQSAHEHFSSGGDAGKAGDDATGD